VARAFTDTFYWIALINPDDAAHERVAAFDIAPDRPDLVTTEETLVEFLTFFSGRGPIARARAVAIARSVAANKNIRVIPQSHQSYMSGLELYASRLDKGFSLTDCISMQTMRRESLSDVLTNDRHFEQEGFRVNPLCIRGLKLAVPTLTCKL